MSSKRKKITDHLDPSDSDASDGNESLGFDKVEEDDVINIDFDAFTPADTDFHAIKMLLRHYIEDAPFNATEMADLVIEYGRQHAIGSVIKAEGNDQAFGFISMIDFHKHKDLECMQQLQHHLLSRLQTEPAKRQQLVTILNDTTRPLGLLLNERLINVPVDIAPPLHRALYNEINEGGRSQRYANFMMVSATYKASVKPGQRKRRPEEEPPASFFKAEEEVFANASILSHSWTTSSTDTATHWTFDGMKSQSRALYLIPSSRAAFVVEEIEKRFCGN